MLKSANRRKVLLILEWCISNFGISKYCDDFPSLRVYKSKGTSEYYADESGVRGTYGDGLITIYLGTISSYRDLCATVIHEYKHYLMNNEEYLKIEKKMFKVYPDNDYVYENHPHEKRAFKAEEKWGGVCYEELKTEFRKRK